MQNNGNRWYDAVLAHWQSEDPIAFAAGDANLYRYCGNDPVNEVDPNGLDPDLAVRAGMSFVFSEEDCKTYDYAQKVAEKMVQNGVIGGAAGGVEGGALGAVTGGVIGGVVTGGPGFGPGVVAGCH